MELKKLNLDAVFAPSSIAVIGASRQPGTIGSELFGNLLRNHFQGVVYPVNRKAKVIQAVRAYASILAIPDDIELAIIAVPKENVLQAAEECARKGVKALVVITAGFKETGEEGEKREKELLRVCRENDIRLVGPNCLGVLNTDPAVQMDGTFAPTYPQHGNVGFSSQSGALGATILDNAKELGIGISKFISMGNSADVSAADLLEYLGDDTQTDVILLYLESFGDVKHFIEVARCLSKRKPIVAVKSGRSKSGARAAASHTGSLAGSDQAVDALFHQTGVIRTDTVEQLYDMAMLLANQPIPAGNRVGIVTNAGGPAIMAADACERWGLQVAPLSEQTQKALRSFLPKEASFRNPVDMIASASFDSFRKAIPMVLEDSAVDSLLVIFVPPLAIEPKEIAEAIVAATAGSRKPVLTCFMGTHGVPEGLRSLKKGKVPSYAFPEDAVAALARASEYTAWKIRPQGQKVVFPDFDEKKIQKITSQSGWLSSDDVFSLLEAARIRMVRPEFASSPEKAGPLARKIGFPVVLKIDSKKILHKSDVGGVALHLNSETEVVEAARKMLERALEKGVEKSEIQGFRLQEMAGEGEEIIIGAHREKRFGPLFMFGLGGVTVELLRDVTFRLHPLTDLDAADMIKEIRGRKLLEGYRGRPIRDIRAVREILLRLSQLLTLAPEIAEFDLNPIKVFEEGKGALVLDARIHLQSDEK